MVNLSDDTGRSPVVLLVEDNPGDARLAKEAFDAVGLADALRVVGDGDEAIEYVRRRGDYADARRPDLVLLDWHLPEGGGANVLTELKTDPGLRRVPVLVLTGSQSGPEVAASYEKHANACIVKPTDPDDLVEVVRAIEEFWLTAARLPRRDEEREEAGPGRGE